MNSVKKLCIVGGGSAGWLTAAYALKNLPWLEVTLIESPNIPIVGVGEATILSFNNFINACGFTPEEWQYEVDATVKSGILFPNWLDGDKTVWHPFKFDTIRGPDFEISKQHLGTAANLSHQDYKKYATTWYDVCVERNNIPVDWDQGAAYHLDATKLANFLSKKCKELYPQLTHIKAHVEDVVVQDGLIHHIKTDAGDYSSDLYIDCTGFKRLLSNSLEGSNWVVKDKMLLNNAALAGHVKYSEDEPIYPYTICQACDYGWIWKIPVQGRIGSGIVFNKDITSLEEAKKLFIEHWGAERVINHDLKLVEFKPEYNSKNWRGNCFSVGLASGFIEPLESTGLDLLIRGARFGLDLIRRQFYTDYDREIFNNMLSSWYDDTMDFVGLHYMNNKRTGPFWDAVRDRFEPSSTLLARLENYKTTYIDHSSHTPGQTFTDNNWRIWLNGVGQEIFAGEVRGDEYGILLNIYDQEKQRQMHSFNNAGWINQRTRKYHEENR